MKYLLVRRLTGPRSTEQVTRPRKLVIVQAASRSYGIYYIYTCQSLIPTGTFPARNGTGALFSLHLGDVRFLDKYTLLFSNRRSTRNTMKHDEQLVLAQGCDTDTLQVTSQVVDFITIFRVPTTSSVESTIACVSMSAAIPFPTQPAGQPRSNMAGGKGGRVHSMKRDSIEKILRHMG